ncbi:MAG: radical SAM protein, partial [Candidatus Omnitrophota bacterium]
IEYLRDAFAVKEIHFIDDNLSFRREHLRRICALLLEKGIRIPWACPNGVRADSIDQETLYLMKKSGCYSLAFGVESADRTILEGVKKHETIDVIRRAIEMTARAGITCQGFFIFGLPGETRRTIDETIRFATGSKLARAQFLILDVLPGSALWEQLRGKFLPRWDKESFREPEWVPEGLTKRDLLSAQTRAFKAFYFRPLILIRMLSFLKFRQIIFLFSRLRDYRILAAHRDVSPRKNGVPPLSGLARKKKIRHFISGIPKSAKILEVGSGDGWLGKYLTGNGWRDYTGLSMTAPADIVGDVARWKELGIAPGSFDVVIAFEVMEHVECVNELCAMLKDGGLLLATLPLPHMDWFCRALEIAGLNQKRGTPHANLRYCKKLPPFETVDYRIVGGISQWGIYRKPIASHQRQHP